MILSASHVQSPQLHRENNIHTIVIPGDVESNRVQCLTHTRTSQI